MRTGLLLSALTLFIFSCKKVKIERLTIGNDKKMIVTPLNIETNLSYTTFPSENLNTELDVDGDGENDIMFMLNVFDEEWVENPGDQLPWEIEMKMLNTNVLTDIIPNSNQFYVTLENYLGEPIDGRENYVAEVKTSCSGPESKLKKQDRFAIQNFRFGDKYDVEDDHNWVNDTQNAHLFAISSEEKIELSVTTIGDEIVQTFSSSKERGCYINSWTGVRYLPFKIVGEEGFNLGWVEIELTNNAFIIKKSAISKKVVKV